MLVILEGPDGAGKTTLLKNLRETLSIPATFIQSNSKLGEARSICNQSVWLHTYPLDRPLIVDRYPFISESIYGPILRNRSLVEGLPLPLSYMEPLALIVYCRPPLAHIKQNVSRPGQRIGVCENIVEITGQYDRMMEKFRNSGLRVVEHNYTNFSNTLTSEKLIKLLENS